MSPLKSLLRPEHVSPVHRLRLVAAAALAGPIAGALLGVLVAYLSAPMVIFQVPHPTEDSTFIEAGPLGIMANTIMVAAVGAFAGGLIGWPVSLALGLPAHAWLVRNTDAGVAWYLGLGLVAGVAAGLAYALALGGDARDFATLSLYGVCAGTAAGGIFWLIRRPDRLSGSGQAAG
jgi:hypothetical protein